MSAFAKLLSSRARTAPGAYFPRPTVPIRYNFDQGQPAPETYPIDDLAEYAQRVIRESGTIAWDYVSVGHDELTYGYLGLRSLIAERVSARDGRSFDASNVILVNGSAHGLSLLAAALVDAGDGVVVEASTFPFMVGYMRARGAEIETVAVDADGMDVDRIPEACARLRERGATPKLVYTIPTFQVPTGTLMPAQRRSRLVELADEHDLAVIEDNCYHEKWFDTAPPSTLLSLDRSERVVQSDSFSKSLAPGLRLGYAIGPADVISAMAAVREDLGVNQILPRVVEAYIRDGRFDEHVVRARAVNRSKRDTALAALRQHCEPHVSYQIPGGGIYFWLELSDRIDVDKLRALAAEGGVACRPGEGFTGDASGRRFLRMAFLHVSEEEIRRGIEVLGEALRASVLP